MKFKASLLCIPVLIFVSAVLPSAGGAEEEAEKVYTLRESINEALENNRSLKAKEEQIYQATQVKNQARSEFLPKFSTIYGYTRLNEVKTFKSSLGGDIAISSRNNFQSVTSVRQPLFRGFALISSFELAKLGIDQSEMQVDLDKLDLALQVKEAYFNILIAEKGIEVAEKDVESRKANVKVARNFYEVGIVPVVELLKAEVELANSQQNLVTARNASRLARSAFNTVLSRPVNAPVEVVDILIYTPEGGEFREYVRTALANRPEMKLIDISLLQADQETRLAKSRYYPEVALTWEYVREGENPDVSGDEFHQDPWWQVTTGLSWTFWEWGKTRYAVKEKESVKKELYQTKMALEERINLQVKEAILALKNAEENIPTTRKAVVQGEENLRVNEERYQAHVTTITEVLDAQTLLTRARVNYYAALYNHNLAKARLDRAIGTY
jgi:outer membrane protein